MIETAEKTVVKTVCVSHATYAESGGKTVFIPAKYKEIEEKQTVYIVRDGSEVHEFLTKSDAEAFVK